MTGFLLTLLRLSLLGSVLGLVLMGVLRLLGNRISRAAGYYLWLLVLLRLCVPVWVELPVPADRYSTSVMSVVMTNPAEEQAGGTTVLFPPTNQGGHSPDSVGGPEVPSEGGETAVPAPVVDWEAVLTSSTLWFTAWTLGFAISLGWYSWSYLRFAELARRCELACDEGAVGKLGPEERRRYGETLLSLAAALPKGLVVTTLCEEKEHLKERLVNLVNLKRQGPAALALALCAALLLGSCSLIGGAAIETQAPEASASAETQAPNPAPTADPDALLTDAALYDLGGGLTLAIPIDIVEDTMVLFDGDLGDGSEPVFPSVYHRSSYEAAMEELDNPMGFLFTLFRYDQAEYEQNYLAVNGGAGQTIFAQGGGWYYGMAEPTDVQYYTTGGDLSANDPNYQRWEYIRSRLADIQADFIARNGLTPYDGRADLESPFLWQGEHRYVECHDADYSLSLTLLLSQPATQGSGGIWCVEGAFENNYGGWSKVLPRGIEVPAGEYYADLQAQVDEGQRPGLLDPVQAAMDWFRGEYGTETLSGMKFTLLEGTPTGNLLGAIRQVADQDGDLESIYYLDETPSTLRGSIGFLERGRMADEISRYLYAVVWVESQAPGTIDGEVMRYRANAGDELLFLEEGGLLRITTGDTVLWYRPAYPYEESPYHRMFNLYMDLAAAEDPFTQEQLDAGMEALSAWFDREGWGEPLEGSLRYMPGYARYHAQLYLQNGKGQGSGLERADVLVLYAAFTADSPRGEGDYVFWLIPDGSGSWKVEDWGETIFAALAG